jgi:hypothetical protein
MASQHPDFWFHDGSIVLCADKTLFRVHQTVLAKHSEVFEDLFSLSQPKAEDDDFVDGCRVVLLHDSKDDFVDLLNAIYNPSCVSANRYRALIDGSLDISTTCHQMRVSVMY